MKSFLNWLDSRTGCKKLLHEALYEKVPGGARWRYVWGSTLTFALAVQFITGLFLWLAYNPSSQTAWESVYYIQNHMTGGAWLRGIHHFTAQAMNVLLVLHLMQVVIDGAYKAPREVNFWFGFVLLLLVMALSLTGYLLPWDQKGFWATKVATNIVAITPLIGPQLQKLIIGGADYGHHTLSRFFALHAGFLPGLIVVLLAGHIYLFRRHGLTVKEPRRGPDTYFWPDQVLKDAVACLAVLATVLFLVIAGKGAELGGPADPTEPYSAARPEWYFLFLFQFLKYFHGGTEVWGAIVIPTLVLIVMCLMPFFGKWRLGHRFNIWFLGVLFIGVAYLTVLAVADDRRKPSYRVAKEAAEREAERVKVLAAAHGIPTSGAVNLLREDAFVQGPKLFARNCASCHRYDGNDALGLTPKDPQSASELKGFGSREWIARLLDPAHVASTNYFGGTKFARGKMVKFVTKDVAAYTPQQKEQLHKVVMALSAEAKLKSQASSDAKDASEIATGRELIRGDINCVECHAFGKPDEDAAGPDLTDYGSREWLISFISNPAHPKFYGKRNDRMPRFAEEKILDAKAIGLIADWLRGDWYEPAATVSVAR
ncbi:MAG TPA: cytochrome b N-terminal domain-containing protein [Candidatus Binatia bacterium]|nr:cytochrome b N-terminal domain-containing protein [Candidatus Binatia bacterium]